MSERNLLGRLLEFLRPFSSRVVLSILMSIATIGSSVGLMMTSAWLISTAGLQAGITTLGVAPTVVRFFGISRAVFRYLERLVSHDVTLRLLANTRVWFYKRIEPLAPAGLMAYRSGDLIARVVSDVDELQNFFIRSVAPPITAIVISLVAIVGFAIFSPMVAVVLAIFLLLVGVGLPYFAWWQSRHPGRRTVETRAELQVQSIDMVQGVADSLVYEHDQALLSSFRQLNDDLKQDEQKLATFEGIQVGLTVLLVNLAAIVILMVATNRVDHVFLATLALGTIAIFEAIMPLTTSAHHLSQELSSAERLFELADTEPQMMQAPDTASEPPSDTTVKIENLTFRYQPDQPPIYENFSLTIPAGERVAIVGASGTGKTSLINVLLRFWEYESGKVSIGDVDLRALAQEDVRRLFGVMSQHTHLFNTSIEENIRIAHMDASKDEIIAAAKVAHIHDFITSLPQGYDTPVGESGSLLSGGERQRIALARVVLRNAPIWILDEATANLDSQTERAVVGSIDAAAAGKTLIVITHRLPLLSNIRHIITLD